MEEEDFWISPKNPICMRKRRCLDFSLTLQEPKEPNLHAIITLVVIICVQRESGSKGKKKERKVVHMSLCSFFMPSQKWIESIRSDTHAHTVNMSQLHTSMSPNCTQVYYKSITTAHYHKCPLCTNYIVSLSACNGSNFIFCQIVSILILQFAILKSGFQFWDLAKQNYHHSCKRWREIKFFSWRDILNKISFFPESIRCCFLSWSFSPLLQNRKTTCSRIFNTHWFWIGALAHWLAAGASIRIFPFFHFSEQAGGGVLISFNKRTQNFFVCTWKVFGQSWEVFFYLKILQRISAQKSPQDWRYFLNHWT